MGNNNCQLAGDTCKESISFCGGVVPGFSSGGTHINLKVVDGTFHSSPDPVSVSPFLGITLDTRKHAQLHVFVGVSGPSLFSCAAGMPTLAKPLPLLVPHFRAAPFDAVCASLFFSHAMVFHGQGRVIWAGRVTVFIIAYFFEGTFITRVIRDKCFGKMETIEQGAIDFRRVKG